MRIFVLSPFGATEPHGEENFQKVARTGTEFTFESLQQVFPLPYNTYRYNTLKCTDAAVERIILAEEEGYDAAVISCMYDPGLFEARAVVDIPVVGTFESAGMLAMMMGERFSVVNPDAVVNSTMRRLADGYGFTPRLASMRHINIVANKLYPWETPTEVVLGRLEEVGRQCVEDGAEVILPGCTIIGALYTHGFQKDPIEVIGVPVLDPMIVAFKMAEMMVDLRLMAGYPAVSRAGMWKKQPAEELRHLREWMRTHPSALNVYSSQ